jgi:hypothetical protein
MGSVSHAVRSAARIYSAISLAVPVSGSRLLVLSGFRERAIYFPSTADSTRTTRS